MTRMKKWHFLWFTAGLLFAPAGQAFAQSTTDKREVFPWDAPPLMCHSEDADKIRICRLGLDGGADAPLVFLRGYGMYGEFDKLEHALRYLADSKEYFSDHRIKGTAVVRILREFADKQVANSVPLESQVLAKWKQAVPDSEFVLLAQAFVLHAEAWNARGEGYASTVSPQAWEIFGNKIREAEKLLQSAPPTLKNTTSWHSTMLRLALDDTRGDIKWTQVFETATGRWPAYLGFYEAVGDRLTPQWGGRWEAVDAFAEEASRKSAATEGASFYARVYSILGDRIVRERPPLNWPKLKTSFKDWIARDATAYTRNRYASFACFARDKAGYRDAMDQLPKEELYEAPWLTGYGPEPCALWASR